MQYVWGVLCFIGEKHGCRAAVMTGKIEWKWFKFKCRVLLKEIKQRNAENDRFSAIVGSGEEKQDELGGSHRVRDVKIGGIESC